MSADAATDAAKTAGGEPASAVPAQTGWATNLPTSDSDFMRPTSRGENPLFRSHMLQKRFQDTPDAE